MEKIGGRSKKRRSTMISVEQMVDLALGNPEIGSVNYNVLHALLHVIIQQLNIQKCLVEFKGSDSERLEGLIMTAKPGPILKLTEYTMNLHDGKPCTIEKGEQQTTDNKCMPGKMRQTFLAQENALYQPIRGFFQDERTVARTCDCDAPPEKKKKQSMNETEKMDTAQEKHDRSKEETDGGEETEEDGMGEDMERRKRREDDADPDSERETTAKERRRSSKKSRTEDAEMVKKLDEEVLKKKKVCPCKAKEAEMEQNANTEQKGLERSRAGNLSQYGSEGEVCQTIVRVEAVGERCDTWRTRPALAQESLVKLEEKVATLQEAFELLENMPTNEELIKRTSTDAAAKTPVKDMWQLFNLNKRMESCEGAIEKLASMIEDLSKNTCNIREAMMVIADAIDAMECTEETCKGGFPCYPKPTLKVHEDEKQEVASQAQYPTDSQMEIVAMPITTPNPCGAFGVAAEGAAPRLSERAGEEIQEGQAPEVEEEKPRRKSQVREIVNHPGFHPGLGPEFFKLSNGEKFCVLKDVTECIMTQMKMFTDLIPMDQLAAKLCSVVTTQKQFDLMQKEWEEFLQCFSNEGVPGAVAYIKTLRMDIEEINDTIMKIFEDNRKTENSIQAIQQDVNLLRAIKADKETVEDMLAEKADASVVNKKVSHDQFDAACDDLTRGLDQALERLIAQEAIWNEAMEELQKDMDSKLDKLEIMPLKEFINKKLMGLQEKLKQLAQLRKDAEAAGAKSRILRNLNCISCDNDVIMRMDNKTGPQQPPSTSTRSTRPYIAYDLDQVRKSLKKGTPCRQSLQPEENASEVQKKNIGLPIRRDTADKKLNKLEHYCNRYCGGSHTITTPQQRVTRIGHFLTEFGPQAMALFNQENGANALEPCKPVDDTSIQIPQKDPKIV